MKTIREAADVIRNPKKYWSHDRQDAERIALHLLLAVDDFLLELENHDLSEFNSRIISEYYNPTKPSPKIKAEFSRPIDDFTPEDLENEI